MCPRIFARQRGFAWLAHNVPRGWTAAKTCTLMLLDEVDQRWRALSVLTPIGTALLGLREDAHMAFQSPEDSESEVKVVRVEGSGHAVENSKWALDRRLDEALD